MHESPGETARLATAAAARLERAEAYVSKDCYATMMRREAVSRNPPVVFKGGSCLSKRRHAIDRFSEVVDLGMAEERGAEGMRKSMKRAVAESAAAPGLGIPNAGETRSRRECNRYVIALP